MRKILVNALPLFMLAFLLAACGAPAITIPTANTTAAPAATTATFPPPSTATATQIPTSTPTQEPSATATATISPTPTPAVLIGAGDIAYCGGDLLGDEHTAEIILRYPDAAVFTAGDNAYGNGTRAEFRNCYGASWGQFKDRTHPAPGNHEYHTDSAAPYFEYFGEAAGEAGKGFYSYNLGDWHIVALNSNCDDISCRPNSEQVEWLRKDLQSNPTKCTLLYWHHPRWTSGLSGNYGSASPFWRVAREFNADVIVNGHDHDYERFAPMDADGNPDPAGIREFIVGTGGGELREFGEPQPNSEVRIKNEFGVIKFNLYPASYEWEFIPVDPSAQADSGSAECH